MLRNVNSYTQIPSRGHKYLMDVVYADLRDICVPKSYEVQTEQINHRTNVSHRRCSSCSGPTEVVCTDQSIIQSIPYLEPLP